MLEMTLGPQAQSTGERALSHQHKSLLPALLSGLALLGGLAFGYGIYSSYQKLAAQETKISLASQKFLPEVNCLQYWAGAQDKIRSVRAIQLRRCDQALGIR